MIDLYAMGSPHVGHVTDQGFGRGKYNAAA